MSGKTSKGSSSLKSRSAKAVLALSTESLSVPPSVASSARRRAQLLPPESGEVITPAAPIAITVTAPSSGQLSNTTAQSKSVPSRDDAEGFVSMTAAGCMARRASLADELQEARRAAPSPSFSEVIRTFEVNSETGTGGSQLMGYDTATQQSTATPAASESGAPPLSEFQESTARHSYSGGLTEAAQQASKAVQDAKEALESRAAGNLKREVREMVVEQLHLLLTLVMSLSESRSRLTTELHRSRIGIAREAEIQAHRYAKSLERVIAEGRKVDLAAALREIIVKQAKLETEMQNLQKDSKAIRLAVTHELAQTVEETFVTVKELKNSGQPEALQLDKLVQELKELCDRPMTLPPLAQPPVETHLQETREVPTAAYRTVETVREYPRSVQRQYTVPRTFADAAATPRFTLLVESADPRHTGDEIINKIKTGVDVVNLGVGVNSVRKCRNSRVAISVTSEEERSRMGSAIKNLGGQLTVTSPKSRDPHLRLIGVTPDMTDAKIEEALTKQNSNLLSGIAPENIRLKVVRRTKGRGNAVNNVIMEVSPQVWNSLRDKRVRLGYQIVPVFDQSPLMQCYRCMGFAHRASDCKSVAAVCGYCTEGHDTRNCPNRNGAPACVHCKSSENGPTDYHHPAYSAECQEWRKWDRIARLAVSYC